MTHYLKLLTFATLITAFSAHCETEIKVQKQEETEVIVSDKIEPSQNLKIRALVDKLYAAYNLFQIGESIFLTTTATKLIFETFCYKSYKPAEWFLFIIYLTSVKLPIYLIKSNVSKLFGELAPQA